MTRRPPRDAATATRLLAAAGLVALLGGIVLIAAMTGDDDAPPPAAAAPTATTTVRRPAEKPPAPTTIAVTGTGAFDPDGDRSENDGDAGLATDGDPATAWKSEHYRTAFRKSGVGLVLDAHRPVRASRLLLTTETPGYKAQVRVGTTPTGPFVAVSGSKTTARRTTFALKPRRGRYLLVWITSMPDGGVAAVNEVSVRAGG